MAELWLSFSYPNSHTLLLRPCRLVGALRAAGKSFWLCFERSRRSSRRCSRRRRSRRTYKRCVAVLKKQKQNTHTQWDGQYNKKNKQKVRNGPSVVRTLKNHLLLSPRKKKKTQTNHLLTVHFQLAFSLHSVPCMSRQSHIDDII